MTAAREEEGPVVRWCVTIERDPKRRRPFVNICTQFRPPPAIGEGWRVLLPEGTGREEAASLAGRLDLALPRLLDWYGSPPCVYCARWCRGGGQVPGCLCGWCLSCDGPRPAAA